MANITIKKSIKIRPKKIKLKQKQTQKQNVTVNINKDVINKPTRTRTNKKQTPAKSSQSTVQPIYIPQVIPQQVSQQKSTDLNQYFKFIEEQKQTIPEKIASQVKQAIKNELESDRLKKKVVTDEEVQNKFIQITPDLNISQIITDEKIFVKPEDYSDRAYIQTLINTATNADSNLLDGHARVSNFVMPERINEPLYIQEPRQDELDEINIMNTEALVSLRTIEPIEDKIKIVEDAIIDIPDDEIIIIEEPKIEKLKFEGEKHEEEETIIPDKPILTVSDIEFTEIKPKKGEIIPEQQSEVFVNPREEEIPKKRGRPKREQLTTLEDEQPTEERKIPPNFEKMSVSELAPFYQELIDKKAKTYTTGEGATIVKVGSEKITKKKMISALESNI